jgi:aspartate racemase
MRAKGARGQMEGQARAGVLVVLVGRVTARGSLGVVLACTELPLALNDSNCGIPALDITRILAGLALGRSQSG